MLPVWNDRAWCMAGQSEDWSTIWQSELNALAQDPEPMEAWAAAAALWAAWWQAGAAFLPPVFLQHEPAGPPQPARTAAPMAASDNGATDGARLAGRVAELEQRIAELERARLDRS